jgi:hypothetical protein
MKKYIVNIFWGTIVCVALIAIFMTISLLIFTMIMPKANPNINYEALGTKLGVPILIVSILITAKILKAGILPWTKKQE